MELWGTFCHLGLAERRLKSGVHKPTGPKCADRPGVGPSGCGPFWVWACPGADEVPAVRSHLCVHGLMLAIFSFSYNCWKLVLM